MKVFVAKRLGLNEGDSYCDVFVGLTRADAIKAIVDGGMREWWRDYQGAEDEENGIEPASDKAIFDAYCEIFDDEESIRIEEEEVIGS